MSASRVLASFLTVLIATVPIVALHAAEASDLRDGVDGDDLDDQAPSETKGGKGGGSSSGGSSSSSSSGGCGTDNKVCAGGKQAVRACMAVCPGIAYDGPNPNQPPPASDCHIHVPRKSGPSWGPSGTFHDVSSKAEGCALLAGLSGKCRTCLQGALVGWTWPSCP